MTAAGQVGVYLRILRDLDSAEHYLNLAMALADERGDAQLIARSRLGLDTARARMGANEALPSPHQASSDSRP